MNILDVLNERMHPINEDYKEAKHMQISELNIKMIRVITKLKHDAQPDYPARIKQINEAQESVHYYIGKLDSDIDGNTKKQLELAIKKFSDILNL